MEILVTRSSMPSYEEYCEEIKDIWDTHWLTNMGAKHQAFRSELMKYMDVDKLDLLTNGHISLEFSMQALDLHGEVITTPFTFASTTHAIVRNGLEPVFCDIEPETYCMDVSKLERLITEKTCAIVPVHVYGNVCQVEAIEKLARKYDLKVIYDAAHAFGVKYKNQGLGKWGDVSCYSFHATKVFNSIEGGCVCYHDEEFGEKIYELKNFGIHGPECIKAVGGNGKLNEFCAAMGLCNLRHIDEEISKRGIVAGRYFEQLDGIAGIKLSYPQKDVKPNYAYFPIVINEENFGANRNEVFEALARNGIRARKYFHPLTNDFECFQGRFDVQQTPIAVRISESVLTLPMFADLSLKDVDRICSIIKSCQK